MNINAIDKTCIQETFIICNYFYGMITYLATSWGACANICICIMVSGFFFSAQSYVGNWHNLKRCVIKRILSSDINRISGFAKFET